MNEYSEKSATPNGEITNRILDLKERCGTLEKTIVRLNGRLTQVFNLEKALQSQLIASDGMKKMCCPPSLQLDKIIYMLASATSELDILSDSINI